jgi:rhodanese-related sulfurtransferase
MGCTVEALERFQDSAVFDTLEKSNLSGDAMLSHVKEIDVQGLVTAMGEEDVVLVDVRTEMEVSRGVIDGAIHIPLHMLPFRADDLPKNRRVVFYCRTGARSAQACAFMACKGYEEVYNLRGGVMAWLKTGNTIALTA